MQRTGHRVHLLKNLLFFGQRVIQKSEHKPGKVLFSGFLIVFLGTGGIQAEIPETVILGNKEMESAESSVRSSCPTEKSTLASLEIANELSEKENSVEVMSEECQAEKDIEKAIKEKKDLPQELAGDIKLVEEIKKLEQAQYEEKVTQLEKMLEGYPLAKMAPEIAKRDPEIAALIVGIARKESQWGVRSPKKNGDCYNYWGFKGAGGRGVGMGHACFATPEEAVDKIANRLEKLVEKKGTSKPSALVTTWKCGSSCASHSPESVRKWVSDVNQYYSKVLALK